MKQISLTVYEKNDLIRFLDYAKMKKIEECTTDNEVQIQYDIETINHLQKILNVKSRPMEYGVQSPLDVMDGLDV